MGDGINHFFTCDDWTVLLTDSAKGPVPWASVHRRGEWRPDHSNVVPQRRHQTQIHCSLLHPTGLCTGRLWLWWATQHRNIHHHFLTRYFINHTSTSHMFSHIFFIYLSCVLRVDTLLIKKSSKQETVFFVTRFFAKSTVQISQVQVLLCSTHYLLRCQLQYFIYVQTASKNSGGTEQRVMWVKVI